MAEKPPSIPVSVTMRIETPRLTLADLKAARDREARNLDQRIQELQRARDTVASLERQVVNVQRSVAELDERIEGASATEKVEFLSQRVADLETEVRELRNPRGRECY